MNSISVKIDSAALQKFLRDAPEGMNRAVTNIIKKTTYLVERYAKQNAPVDTGRLRSSIYNMVTQTSGRVSTNTNYAVFVHDGTRYMRARPFMRQAAEQVAGEELDNLIDGEINNVLQ